MAQRTQNHPREKTATSVAPVVGAPAASSVVAAEDLDHPGRMRLKLRLRQLSSAACWLLTILGGVAGHHAETGTDREAAAAASRRRISCSGPGLA